MKRAGLRPHSKYCPDHFPDRKKILEYYRSAIFRLKMKLINEVVCFLFLFNVAHSWPPLQSGKMGRENFFYRLRERRSNLTWKCFIARPSQKQLLSSILLGSFTLPTSNANIRFFIKSIWWLILFVFHFALNHFSARSSFHCERLQAADCHPVLHWRSWCSVCDTLTNTSPTQLRQAAAAERAACASCGTAAIRPVNTTRLFHGFVSYLLKTVCSKCVFFFTFMTCWCFTFNPTWKPICLIFFVWDVTVNSSCSYCSFNVESILFSNQASMMSLIKMKLTVMLIFPNKIHWPSCYLVKSWGRTSEHEIIKSITNGIHTYTCKTILLVILIVY